MADAPAAPSWFSLKSEDRPARLRGGFTLRSAGSMKSPAVREAVLREAGLGGRPAFYLRQVHGDVIVPVRADSRPDALPEADGWVTDVPGPVLCVYMADCVPLLIWERTGKAVGAFHAGWRGLAKGMPTRAVEAFAKHYGIAAADLRAEIGPRVGACCYRVGPETAEQFRSEVRTERAGGVYLDLAKEAEIQLRQAGVGAVSKAGFCTSCHAESYFSFRRDKSDDRMMAFVSLENAA